MFHGRNIYLTSISNYCNEVIKLYPNVITASEKENSLSCSSVADKSLLPSMLSSKQTDIRKLPFDISLLIAKYVIKQTDIKWKFPVYISSTV